MEILAQMYLRELIKQDCWDSMTVKGKVLKVNESNAENFYSYIHISFIYLGISVKDRSE